MLYEFQQGHNAVEATKNIYYAIGEDAVDESKEGSRSFTWVT